MKLSKRLQAIADLIIKYKHGHILGDIGTDHAYLPCYLVSQHNFSKAYACDIAKGPIQASIETIQSYHLENKVIPLLGSGIQPLLDKKVDMISLCGMGGKLIVDILNEYPDYIKDQRLFLQANVGLEVLREYLSLHHFEILDEDIVKDAHHIYEIIVCQKTTKTLSYNENDFYFGPCLRQNKNALFYQKWQRQLEIHQNILTSLEPTHPRYQEVSHMIEMIEGEINES